MILSRNRTLAVVVVLVVAADWVVKGIVQARLALRVPHTVVEGWFSLVHTVNHGISWGGLSGTDTWWRFPLILVLTALAIGATVSVVRASTDPWLRLGGALVLGGALGNLGDRLARGGVTDYLHVHFFPFIFNLADVAITVGGALLALRLLAERPPSPGGTAAT